MTVVCDISEIKKTSGSSALVVDDESFIRKLVAQVLYQVGVKRVEVAGGAEGAKLLLTHGFNPDFLVTDRVMPAGNGIELIKWVRTNTLSPNNKMPILMVSANSKLREIAEARDAGMSEFLVKPISIDLLASRVSALLEKPRPFINCRDFYGPDRRRRIIDPPGHERRARNSNRPIDNELTRQSVR